MTEKQGQIVYRSLHAPKENGAVLIEPTPEQFEKQIKQFCQSPSTATRVGWKLKDFYQNKILARQELIQLLGLDWAAALSAPIVMVGHQPHLFHPGVWMKNFVTSRIAKKAGGIDVNLIVDNDVSKSPVIAVPTQEQGAIAQIAFDSNAEEMPYEERLVLNREIASHFAEQVISAMPPAERDQLIVSFWQAVEAGLDQNGNWGQALSSARRSAEATWGTEIVDVKLSDLVGTHSFARLVLEITHDALSFAQTYNACLADYRKVHGLRSRSHPAPDLEIISEDEIELPFWLWTSNAPRRKRTFMRRTGDEFTITDRETIYWTANFREGKKLVERLVSELLSPTNLPHRPKLRPKALITTLYARLFLCDGFVHGIGGAKYDQVTESIAARWGLGSLAPMQCATMTLRLPLPMEIVSIEEVRRRKRKQRELTYHPERYLEEADLTVEQRSRAEVLSSSKREWISRTAPENLRERHHSISAINAELSAFLSEVRKRVESEYQDLQSRFTAQQPWLSREFAAVLFPEEMLKREFARVVGG